MSSLWHGAPWSSEDINARKVSKTRSKKNPNAKRIGDQVIREIRALHQYRMWTAGRLAERYGLKRSSVKNILEGITGALVTFSERDVPAAE